MSGELRVSLDKERATYEPGERVRARVELRPDTRPAGVLEGQWQLLWFTEGRGEKRFGVVATGPLVFDTSGPRHVEAHLPEGPWSYEGVNLHIRWAVQARVLLGTQNEVTGEARLELLAPGQRRVCTPPER